MPAGRIMAADMIAAAPCAPSIQMDDSNQPVVLMLHGLFGSAQNWRACAEALSARARVLVPQLPLLGMSQREARLEQLGDFLGGLIRTEKARRLVVLGNSFGGQLAVNLALREPERIAGLVLTGSSGLYERSLKHQIQRRPERDWLIERIAEIFFDEAMVTGQMVDDLIAITRDRKKLRDVLQLAKLIRKTSVRELLPRIHCPVLLVWGADDIVTPPDTAREFARLLPDAELHFIANCGHVPMMERPDEFNRLVENFLRRVSPARV